MKTKTPKKVYILEIREHVNKSANDQINDLGVFSSVSKALKIAKMVNLDEWRNKPNDHLFFAITEAFLDDKDWGVYFRQAYTKHFTPIPNLFVSWKEIERLDRR